MDNVYDFPDRATIEQEAGEWIIKLDGATPPTPEERRALQEWINRSPVHRQEIGNLAEFWGKMNVLTELAVPLGKTDSQIRRDREKEQRSKFFIGGGAAVAAACVFGIAITLGLWFQHIYQDDNGLYATAVGQQMTTTLSDGSVVQLNTNSQIEVDFNEQHRDIRLLQGEAYFSVAKNPDRPFRVYAGNGRVQAVGTAFSVYLKGLDIDVIVTEGKVGLVALNQPHDIEGNNTEIKSEKTPSGLEQASHSEKDLGLLEAGQRTTIKTIRINNLLAESAIETIENIDDDEMAKQLAWRDGLLTFNGDPLEEVVAVISRYSQVSIAITDPAVRAIKIGGQFRVGETDAMLDSLETNFGLNVRRVGYNQVELSFSAE